MAQCSLCYLEYTQVKGNYVLSNFPLGISDIETFIGYYLLCIGYLYSSISYSPSGISYIYSFISYYLDIGYIRASQH